MKKRWFLYTSLIILILFVGVYLLKGNIEFLAYGSVAFVLILLIHFTDKKYSYNNFAKVGFLIWLFLHMAGGILQYKGTRWYGIVFYEFIGEPFHILKYDQVLHFFFYFIAAIFFYQFVKTIVKKDAGKYSVFLVVVLSVVGIGALNEIIELAVYVSAESGVGTYINNALDLIFNTFGAIVGAIVARRMYNQVN